MLTKAWQKHKEIRVFQTEVQSSTEGHVSTQFEIFLIVDMKIMTFCLLSSNLGLNTQTLVTLFEVKMLENQFLCTIVFICFLLIAVI